MLLYSICRQWGLTKCWRSGPPGVTRSQLTSQLHTKICQVLQESSQGHTRVGCASTAHLRCRTLPPAAARELFLGHGHTPWGCSEEQLKILTCVHPPSQARQDLLPASEQMDISLCFAFILWPGWGLGWHCVSSGVGQSRGVRTGMDARMLYAAARLVAGTSPPTHSSLSL